MTVEKEWRSREKISEATLGGIPGRSINKGPKYEIFIAILFWKNIFKVLRRITEDVVVLGHKLP